MRPDTDNPIVAKSFAFAMRIVRLRRHFVEQKREYTLSKELLIAGTHVGKHVKEAVHGESRARFGLEMGAALRKVNEVKYWLQLIHFAELTDEKEFLSIDIDRTELAKMLTSITKSTRAHV